MNELPIEELKANFCYTPTTGVVIHKVRKGRGVKAMQPAGSMNGRGYLVTQCKGMGLFNHRIAWALHYGEWPAGEIDHVDRNKLNNKIENLRDTSKSENQRNRERIRNTPSGIRGVSWHNHTGKWQATIYVDSKNRHLGCFDNIDDAAMVRRIAEHCLWQGIHEFPDYDSRENTDHKEAAK